MAVKADYSLKKTVSVLGAEKTGFLRMKMNVLNAGPGILHFTMSIVKTMMDTKIIKVFMVKKFDSSALPRESVLCAEKNKAIPGKTKCMRCTQKYNAYFRKYYERNKITSGELTRHERIENGLCYYCGEKIDVIGKRACSKCCKEYSTHFNQEIRPANYWKNDNAMVFVSKAQREAIEMGNSKNVYHAKPYYLTSMSGGGT